MQNHYHYDAFGVILESEENIQNRITYTGQQYDSITQQYYLRVRCYNPIIGRFTQEDVYRGDGLNLYAYCSNNPVVYYDPSGYASVNKESTFPTVAASSHNEQLAEQLNQINLMRMLRDLGTPEGQATAKLLKHGKIHPGKALVELPEINQQL